MQLKNFLFIIFYTVLAQFANAQTLNNTTFWQDVPESSIACRSARAVHPPEYRTLEVEMSLLYELTAQSAGVLTFPLANGGEFTVELVATSAIFPVYDLVSGGKTYTGRRNDTTAFLTVTLDGFFATIVAPGSITLCEPYAANSATHAICYHWKATDYPATLLSSRHGRAATLPQLLATAQDAQTATSNPVRLVFAATAAYTQTLGNTPPEMLSAFIVATQRLSAILEAHTGIRCRLVPQSRLLIFSDSGNAPFARNTQQNALQVIRKTTELPVHDVCIVFCSPQEAGRFAADGSVDYIAAPHTLTQSEMVAETAAVVLHRLSEVNGWAYPAANDYGIENQAVSPLSAFDIGHSEAVQFSVTPNPSDGYFSLLLKSSQSYQTTISVSDTNGKVIYTETLTAPEGHYQHQLQLFGLSEGVYFVSVAQNGNQNTRQIVIQ